MTPNDIKKLPDDTLLKKENAAKVMVGLLIGISIPLLLFAISDIRSGDGDYTSLIIVVLLWITVPFSYAEMKKFKQERERRGV